MPSKLIKINNLWEIYVSSSYAIFEPVLELIQDKNLAKK